MSDKEKQKACCKLNRDKVIAYQKKRRKRRKKKFQSCVTMSNTDEDEKVPTKPKVSDKSVEAFVKNIDNCKGQNRDMLIKLGLAKPDVEEKEQHDKPSWCDGFKDVDSHNNHDNGHETKTINI
eukprot:jgi/Bigna1/134768/aug1.26_g9476